MLPFVYAPLRLCEKLTMLQALPLCETLRLCVRQSYPISTTSFLAQSTNTFWDMIVSMLRPV